MLTTQFRVLSVLVAVALVPACAPKVKVYRLMGEGAVNRPGVVYTLPRTLVTVDFPVKKTVISEGECSDYAIHPDAGPDSADNAMRQQILQILNVLKIKFVPTTAIQIGDVVLGRDTEPDPDQIFVADVGPRFFNRVDTTIELAETTEIGSAKTVQSNEALKFTWATVAAIGEIAASAISKLGVVALAVDEKVDSKLQLCRASAGQVVQVANARFAAASTRTDRILAGQDTKAVDKSLANLEVEAKRLRTLFGDEETTSGTVSCSFAPPAAGGQQVLFNLDSAHGITGAYSGCRVPPAFATETPAAVGSKAVTLSVTETSGSVLVTAQTDKLKIGCDPNGFYYRIPGVGDVEVKQETKSLVQSRMAIAQFGSINALPTRTGNLWGESADITFYGETGGLEKLVATGAAAETESIGKLGESLGGVAKAVGGIDENAKLKGEKERLALKVEIKKLEEELHGAEVEESAAP